jgi:hypothetical protein
MDFEEDFFAASTEITEDFFSEEEAGNKKPVNKKPENEDDEDENEDVNKDSDDLFTEETIEQVVNKEKEEINVLSIFKEKGIIDFEDTELEGVEDTDEFLTQKLDEVVEAKVKDYFDDVPEQNKEIVKYLLQGGNVSDLLQTYSQAGQFSEDLDIEEESNQILVVKKLMIEDGESEEFVDSYIESLKETGKLKIIASKKFDKWKEEFEEDKKSTLKANEERIKKEKETIFKTKTEFAELLKDKKELGIMPIAPEDKKVLPSYLSEKSVKLQNGQKITPFYSDLFYKVLANKTSAAQLAILVKSAKEDGTLDFKRIENTIKTKETKEIKEELARANKNKKPSSAVIGGGGMGTRSLADLL